eukprot:1755300-Amphidinium_carterae.1
MVTPPALSQWRSCWNHTCQRLLTATRARSLELEKARHVGIRKVTMLTKMMKMARIPALHPPSGGTAIQPCPRSCGNRVLGCQRKEPPLRIA